MEIYFKDDNLTIRTLTYSDAEEITQEECAQGWNASIDKYCNRLKDMEDGKAVALAASEKELLRNSK